MSCRVAAVEVVRGCKGDRMQRARRHKVEATVFVLCFLRRRLRGREREEECRARRKSFDMEWKCCARSGTGRCFNFHSSTRWHVGGDYGCELGRQSRCRKRRSMRVHRAREGDGTKVKGAIGGNGAKGPLFSINAINETAETWKGSPGVHLRRPIS